MNADQERLLKGWLDARDPGDAPARLRAAVSQVPYSTRPSPFPALDALLARLLGPSAVAGRVAVLVVLLALALAVVGAALLLRSEPAPPRGLIAYVASLGATGRTGISLVAADGTGARRVTALGSDVIEHSPRWSADGRTLLFARTTGLDPYSGCTGTGSIVLYDLATGTERVIASGLVPSQRVEWSPSGDEVAFVHPPAGCNMPAALNIVDTGGGRVTTSPLAGGGLAWELRWVAGTPVVSEIDLYSGDVPSLDGKLEADCGGVLRDPTHRLVITDRKTGDEVDLGQGQAGSWSQDGTAIAFIQATDKGANGRGVFHDQLAVAGVGTWQVRVLGPEVATTQLFAPELRWTPDGRAIYWSDAGGGHVVDIASGAASDLPPAVKGGTDLQWQPTPPS